MKKITTIPQFSDLIKDNNFTDIYSYCPKELPEPKRFSTDFKVYKYNGMTATEKILDDMKKDGYVPANPHELLGWFKNRDDIQWRWTIAMDSSSVFQGESGNRCFLCVVRRGDADRELSLVRVGSEECYDGWAFLAVKSLDAKVLEYNPLDTHDSLIPIDTQSLTRIENKIDLLLKHFNN